ncbi:iron dicitrate transport regulator FecR [Chitinophaga alhagiae]|uniref:Iron dicitrate transport regulator FecR n=1 Tax=Chitinophaga alhagiae TaxID=2203219 RepID=A0ABM6W8M9_9BACT|nr:FecR family protein [Chitinophaga alhagiae]AWO00291.1 iron dicitrate transport regulator FecR [Chitinophaga alhagiae]
MSEKRLEELFARYYEQLATAEETAELMELVRKAPPEKLAALIVRHGEALEHLAPVTNADEAEGMLQAILGAEAHGRELPPYVDRGMEAQHATPLRNRRWWRVAAAAIILGTMASSAFWLLRNRETAVPATVDQVATADISPAREKAVLLLDDSSAIGLDTLANGTTQQQGGAFTHTNGQLVYNATGNSGAPVYNTIATGKGNYYKLVLSDGTRVWLNAASLLRFPVVFSNTERLVEVKGEAYFEVVKDAARPFRVKLANESMVEVLGTHFNINAYAENAATRTTLLEGAVKVTRGAHTRLLKPGQQAVAGAAGITLENGPDLGQVMAWKNGYFWFENSQVRDIMAEAARWYDVDVRYEGNITEEGFSGKFSREAPLSRLLQILELNGIHVMVNGKTITIQQ